MSSPPGKYVRLFDFTDFSTAHPDQQQPGIDIDNELDAIKVTTDKTIDRLGEIQRDDGKLRNLSVHKDALSADTLALVSGTGTPRGAWLTATAYVSKDMVSAGGLTYIAVTAHTSTTFAADLAAGKWLLFANGYGASLFDAPVSAIISSLTGAEAEGYRALVAHSGTSGALIGYEDQVVQIIDGVPSFSGAPSAGMRLFNQATKAQYSFDGATWKKLNSRRVFTSNFTTVAAAIAFAVSAGLVLVHDDASAAWTPTVDTDLSALPGVIITDGTIKPNGHVVTMPSYLEAPRLKWIDISSGGHVDCRKALKCDVEWWGAVTAAAFNSTLATANTLPIDEAIAYGAEIIAFQSSGIYSTTGHIVGGERARTFTGRGRDATTGIIGSGIDYAHKGEVTGDAISQKKFVFQNGANNDYWTYFQSLTIQADDVTATVAVGVMQSTTVPATQWCFNFDDCRLKGYVGIHWGWANLNTVKNCDIFGYYAAESQVITSATTTEGRSIQKLTYICCQFSQTRNNGGQIHFWCDNGTQAIFSVQYIGCTSIFGNDGYVWGSGSVAGNHTFIDHHNEGIQGTLLVGETANLTSMWSFDSPAATPNTAAQVITQKGPRSWVRFRDTMYFGTGSYLEVPCGITFVSGGDALSAYTKPTAFTPNDNSGAGLTFTSISCFYEIVGKTCRIWGTLTFPTTANGNNASIGNLPKTIANDAGVHGPIGAVAYGAAVGIYFDLNPNTKTMDIDNVIGGADVTNATLSGKTIKFSGSYQI